MKTDFHYEARNANGQLVGGTISADSVEQASDMLGDQELYITRLAVERTRSRRTVSRFRAARASRTQIAWLMSQLSIMVEAGIPLSEALHITTRQVSKPNLRALLEDVCKSVDEGVPLSDAMGKHPGSFPPSLIAMIRASELNGTLSQMMKRSSQYLHNDVQTMRRIRGVLIYPAFMILLSVGVVLVLLTFVLPRFAAIFVARGAALPVPTRILMAMSNHLINYWFEWAAGTIVICAVTVIWLHTSIGRYYRDVLLLTIPVFSKILHGLYQARAFRTIALLVKGGVPIMDVITIAQTITPNALYQKLWSDVEQQVRDGSNLSAPLYQSKLISESVAQMFEAGERSAQLSQVLSCLADYTEEEYNQTLKAAMQLIEPCMILFIGGLVGFIAAALMLPLFRASQLASGV
jgi:type IV pilus assembly protein PilC